MGPTRQLDPHVIEMETEPAALLYGRGQSSPTANLPTVTSSRRDLLDLAHLMSHLAGPIVDASDDGGGNGGAARRDHGGTPVEATAKHKRAQTSFPGLRRTYRARLHGLRWREVPQPR